MKKIVSIFLVFMVVFSTLSAVAAPLDVSDLSFVEDLSDQELVDLRNFIDDELSDRKREAAAGDDEVLATRDVPALIGETFVYAVEDYVGEREYGIEVVCVAQGSVATAIVKTFNSYNARQTKKGEKWVLVQVRLEALSSDEEKIEFSDYYFNFVDQNGMEYNRAYLSDNPAEMKALYIGSEQYAWIAVIVKDADVPMLTHKPSGGDDTAWFDLTVRKEFNGDEISEPMDKNSTGDEVLFLQRLLIGLEYFAIAPNGEYDKTTISAVKAFQRANGLKQSGNVDEETIACLLSGEALPKPAGKK